MHFLVQVLPAHRDLAHHHVARVDRVARHVDLDDAYHASGGSNINKQAASKLPRC